MILTEQVKILDDNINQIKQITKKKSIIIKVG